MSSGYKASMYEIKDFTNLWIVSEASGFGEARAMLTDREKMILHFCCMITIAKMTNMPNYKQMLETMVKDIRKNRCRSLSSEDVAKLLEDVNEEMVCGRIMFQHLMGDAMWSMTGERPNKNTDWRDMR